MHASIARLKINGKFAEEDWELQRNNSTLKLLDFYTCEQNSDESREKNSAKAEHAGESMYIE